jgi:hypothetical protein
MLVHLNAGERVLAVVVGGMRESQNRMKGRPDRFGCQPGEGWNTHIEGAAGELAFAKATGLYWSGNLGNLAADDVGPFQVRTRSRHEFDLILHDTDPDDRAFVLMTGLLPNYVVRGWIFARDGKLREYWKDPAKGRPAYFVPQAALRPIAELQALLPAPTLA